MSEPNMNGGPDGGRGLSEADREVFAQDAAFGIAREKLSADADARMVVARVGWFAAFVFAVAFGVTLTLFAKSSMAWSNARLPFVWANAQGTTQLVSNATVDRTWEGIPDVVVQSELRKFLDMRYGSSSYHVRQFWGPLTTYWLSRAQTNDFLREMKPIFDDLQREGYWRRIQVRSIQFDKKSPAENGGTRYLAQIEYLASDMRAEDSEARRMQLYKLKLDFNVGTPPGATDPNQLVLWAQNNPINFRVLESFRSDPVEIPMGAPVPVPGASFQGAGVVAPGLPVQPSSVDSTAPGATPGLNPGMTQPQNDSQTQPR